ncbi:hypothetical protein C8J56DRAFT_334841 [Mycena floridula]|nr:hypothetical protein C8J56DRAFT_334841 [Mycena floridula]
MPSPSARAEARRKAILSRGSDRLAKLTTSARGEEGLTYTRSNDFARAPSEEPSIRASSVELHDDPPLPSTGSFLGEDATADPSAWSEDQQMQLMRAMMGGMPGTAPNPLGQNPFGGQPNPFGPGAPNPFGDNNPFAAMMQQAAASGGAPSMSAPTKPLPKSRLSKILPLLHVFAMWSLLAYFVGWVEPRIHEASGIVGQESIWTRWTRPLDISLVPFFYAFTTVEIVLHSTRIWAGLDTPKLPSLLAFALPHLPPPLPTVIMQGLKYINLFSLLLDDISALLVGLGLMVWIGSWMKAGRFETKVPVITT